MTCRQFCNFVSTQSDRSTGRLNGSAAGGVTSRAEIAKAFRILDANADGGLSVEELCRMLTAKNYGLTTAEVKQVFGNVDKNRDGTIDFNEFAHLASETAQKSLNTQVRKLEKAEKQRRLDKAKKGPERSVAHRNCGCAVESAATSGAKSSDHRNSPKRPKEVERLQLDSGRSSARSSRLSQKSSGTLQQKGTPQAAPQETAAEQQQTTDEEREGAVVVKRKGFFFYDENDYNESVIVGLRYKLNIDRTTNVTLTIEPTTNNDVPSDLPYAELIVAVYNSITHQIIAVTVAQREKTNVYHSTFELDAGCYRLFPLTTGCRFRPREQEKDDEDDKPTDLLEGMPHYKLTKKFRMVLMNVFDMFDCDDDGLLNRQEFSLYNERTGDESVTDEEWKVVQENFHCKDGLLTMKGFIELHQLEAKDAKGDTEDLWLSLQQVGYNKHLAMDEACPYLLTLSSQNTDVQLLLDVETLSSVMSETPEWQALVEYFWSQATVYEAGCEDLLLKQWCTDFCCVVLALNRGETQRRFNLQLAGSKNVIVNPTSPLDSFSPKPQEIQVLLYAVPKEEQVAWHLGIEVKELQCST